MDHDRRVLWGSPESSNDENMVNDDVNVVNDLNMELILSNFGLVNEELFRNKDNDTQITALQHAFEIGNIELFEFLLKNGANPNTLYLDVERDGVPESLLMELTSGFSFIHIDNPDFPYLEYAKLLLEYGANVNYTDDEIVQPTALHIAASQGDIEMVRLLLNYFPDVSIKADINEYNQTARDVAVEEGHQEIVDLIDSYIAARRIQSKYRGRRTLKNLNRRLAEDQGAALGLPYGIELESYMSPLNRRELIGTLARDKRQKMTRRRDLEESMRTAKFLEDLKQYGGRTHHRFR